MTVSLRGARVALMWIITGLLFLALPGCQTHTGTALDRRATQGALVGVLTGAAAGAAVDDHRPARGALIGAAVGGLTGGLIGNYLDQQSAELDRIPDAAIQRHTDLLVVGFSSDLLFEDDSFVLAPGAYSRLDRVAETLLRHPDSEVVVRGHTDSRGSETHNLLLSENRAAAVRTYLIARGVPGYRITAMGFGEAMPIARNRTEAGRQQNRRVEIEIRPGDPSLREDGRRSGPRADHRRPGRDAWLYQPYGPTHRY